jgi:hypothetical protein
MCIKYSYISSMIPLILPLPHFVGDTLSHQVYWEKFSGDEPRPKEFIMPNTPYGPNNPHPLSQLKTELVWDGKYDEYGNCREVDVAGLAMPLQKIEPEGGLPIIFLRCLSCLPYLFLDFGKAMPRRL